MEQLEWDYKGWAEPARFFATQTDWNQTLLTMINKASITIHEKTFRGGGNRVIINSHILPIIKDLAYTEQLDDGSYKISGRYKVELDDSLSKNIVRVYHHYENLVELQSKNPNIMIVVKETKPRIDENDMGEISMVLHDMSKPEYAEALLDPANTPMTKENLTTEILIKNYDQRTKS